MTFSDCMPRVLDRTLRAFAFAAVVSVTVTTACSVYDTALLGSEPSPNGVSGDGPFNTAGVAGSPSPAEGGAGTGGVSSGLGAAGDGGASDAGNSAGGDSFGGAEPQTGGASTGGSAANGGGGLGGKAGSGGKGGSGGNTTTLVELGKGKSVTASSQQTENAASQGNDGDTATRWAATSGSFPQWWRVDLAAVHQVSQISLRFEHPDRTYSYTIETSNDDAVYTLQRTANGTGVTQNLTLPAGVTARYVRVTVTNGLPLTVNGNGTWASFWECSLLGY